MPMGSDRPMAVALSLWMPTGSGDGALASPSRNRILYLPISMLSSLSSTSLLTDLPLT